MSWELGVRLAEALAWPLFAVVLVLIFRRPTASLLNRIRELEGPASIKAKLDPNEIARIVEEGRKEDVPAKVIAQRIVKHSLIDAGERRVLRALLDEQEGRYISAYKTNYPAAIDNLQALGYIRREHGRFILTESGREAASAYLLQILAKETSGNS